MAFSKAITSARYWRSSDQHIHINKCTFGEQARNKMDKAKREQQRDVILKCACALLNSGGGVISAGVENEDYDYYTMSLGEDMQMHLKSLLNPANIEDFIEFVPSGNALQMYVKSWCSHDNRARLCSVDSGLKERSGTSTLFIPPSGVLDFIKKKRQTLNSGPPAKKRKWSQGDELIYQKAEQFYEKQEARLGQILDFGESVNVEFKSFDSEKNLEKRLKENLPKYLSAFGNTKGGFLFIGVDDKSKEVVGCGRGMDAQTMEQMIQEICNRAQTRAFHLLDCARKEEWSVDCEVFEVMENSGKEPRYIVGFKVPAFCCAVFEDNPKCWHIENDAVTLLDPRSWLEKIQLCDPGDDLSSRFNKVLSLKDSPPQCRSVYSTKDIATLQERIFSVREENVLSRYIPQELQKYEKLLNIPPIQSKSGPGILIMSTSWAIDVNLPRNKSVICEALLISTDCYPTLFCWAEGDSPELRQYVNDTAFSLKQKLVNLGGYTGRLCVIPCLVNCQTGEVIQNETDCAPPYPDSYTLGHIEEVLALLRSLTIVVMSISSPLSDTLGCEFFNLLTEVQYAILRSYNGIRSLLIYGPPGSGKTLIAMEKIRRIKNSDNCEDTDILYLCENVGLRDFVRKQFICMCETRASFMKSSEETFSRVKHIIVDEGQNFRLEHGDWYKKANRLVEKNGGIFWIFVDYFQRSHTSSSGLPPLKSQNEAFLYEVVRNSREVFDAMLDLIHQIADNSKPEETAHFQDMVKNVTLSHSFRGQLIRRTDLQSVETKVVTIIRNLLQQGHSAKDIAVLYSTKEEICKREYGVKKEKLPVQFGSVENIDQGVVVLDTIRRFSGLERNIVILVDPTVHVFQNEVEVNVLLSAFSRARIRLYVLQSKRSILTSTIPY